MKRLLLVASLVSLLACSSSGSAPGGSGGTSGGAGGVGQPTGTGGSVATGGSMGSGGEVGSGGSAGRSGSTGSGGEVGSGGSAGRGGSTGSGGIGGTGAAGGTTGQSDPAQTVCEAQCAQQQRCFPDKFLTAADKAACVPTCIAKNPPADTFRDGVLASVAECVRDLPCSGNDDLCLIEAAQQQDPNWIDSPDGKACLATYKTCNASGYPVGYADESCGLFVIFSPSTLAAFDDCLAKPCPQVADCVGAVIPL